MDYSIPRCRVGLVRESLAKLRTSNRLPDSSAVFKLLGKHFLDCAREEFLVLCLDAKNDPIGWHVVSTGTLTHALVHPREVFQAAILMNAAAVVIAHNHPSGDPTPSQEDRMLTTRLVSAGHLLGIRVLDHVVVGDGRYVSFADQGWIEPSAAQN